MNFKPVLHHSSVSFMLEEDLESPVYLRKELMIIIAGPLLTISIGCYGFFNLILNKSNKISQDFILKNYGYVYLTLFWLRQVFNLFTSLLNSVLKGKFCFGGDESKISKMLNLNPGFFGVLSGTIGLLICTYTIFIVVPKKTRINLIIGGFIGSVFSFVVWTYIIGSFVLP